MCVCMQVSVRERDNQDTAQSISSSRSSSAFFSWLLIKSAYLKAPPPRKMHCEYTKNKSKAIYTSNLDYLDFTQPFMCFKNKQKLVSTDIQKMTKKKM